MDFKKLLQTFLITFLLFGCDDIIESDDISEKQVQLLAPSNGSVITDNTINLNWIELEDILSYKIQIAQPNFENATQILLDSVIKKDTALTVLPTQINNLVLLNGNYEWRIKASNGSFETLYNTASFNIDGDANLDIVPPITPDLTTPANTSTVSGTEISFAWTRANIAGTAEKDSIYIFTDADTNDLHVKGLGANKAFTTNLEANTYYWYVKAFDEAGNKSNVSATFNFTNN